MFLSLVIAVSSLIAMDNVKWQLQQRKKEREQEKQSFKQQAERLREQERSSDEVYLKLKQLKNNKEGSPSYNKTNESDCIIS